MDAIRITPGDRERHAAACATILNDWIDATGWMPRIHTPESARDFVADILFAMRRVWVAEDWVAEDLVVEGREVLGFLALDIEGTITALYVAAAARGRGVGRALLDRAKSEGRLLELWAFQPNRGARRFYEREGFQEVRRTDGDNEEGVPDVLMRWNA